MKRIYQQPQIEVYGVEPSENLLGLSEGETEDVNVNLDEEIDANNSLARWVTLYFVIE